VPHIHAEIDFVVSMFVVHPTEPKVCLLLHKKLGSWLPPGGHIDLGQTSDEAVVAEMREETGLEPADYTVVQPSGRAQDVAEMLQLGPERNHNQANLWLPWEVDIHDFPPVKGHRHLALVYLLFAHADRLTLEADKASDIMWFGLDDLDDLSHQMLPAIRVYCKRAIRARYPRE
jgi:8-oxo-dGTP pyrophosphatase MutT (NUDIX family)